MKQLSETIDLMKSADYKERFAAEYYQLETRFLKLKAMCLKWDEGKLEFTPTCPRDLYEKQLFGMLQYIVVLLDRAEREGVKLDVDDEVGKAVEGMVVEGEVPNIKLLRRDIDDVIQRVRALESCRETSLVITKLQEAVMWLGMDLKRLHEANPYPSSKDPSTGDRIEPTADGLKF